MRGGVSYINILYLDMNNSYGCAMRQDLPISNFIWLMRIKNNSSTG